MKQILLLLFVFSGAFAGAQVATDTTAPFRRFPSVAPFKLLQPDSVHFFAKADLPKDQAVLLMLFSPSCDHCQKETEDLIKRIDDFRNIQIVMATPMPFNQMKEFHQRYQLSRFPNIHVGFDYQFFLPTFYRVRNLPFLVMYDKSGKLLSTFEGNLGIDNLLQVFR